MNQWVVDTDVSEVPKEIRVFEFNYTFVDPPTPENDQAWDDLLPVSFYLRARQHSVLIGKQFGRGYILVRNGAEYGLAPGFETPHGEIYSVAMYHQLHCLGLIRRNYWRLLNGIVGSDGSLLDEVQNQVHNSHTGHCLDYIRQSFECAADMSLEWPRTETDGRRFQVDGNGIPHVCTSKVSTQKGEFPG